MNVRVVKLTYFLIAMCVLFGTSWALPLGDTIKWKAVKGVGDEFFVYFPEGLRTADDGGFLVSSLNGDGVKVDRIITVFRYLDGVALIMEYYEGDAKGLQDSLRLAKDTKVKEQRTIGDFAFKDVLDISKERRFARIQQFRIKNRLYVLKSTKAPEESAIAKAFFESVRLVSKGQMIGPNYSGTDLSNVSLPEIQQPTAVGSDASYDEKDVDQAPISVFRARLNVAAKERPVTDVKIRVRVSCSPDGLVEKPEVISPAYPVLDRLAVEAAQNSFFVPGAIKGKVVPVRTVLEYVVQATVRINALVKGN